MSVALRAKLYSLAGRISIVARKLLMVDDSEIVIASVIRWLKLDGYEIVVTHNCAEARAVAREHLFCAHVIDLELPDGNGIELAMWLRREGQPANTVFFTGHSIGDKALEEARQFGRVVIKGEHPRVLLAALYDMTHSQAPAARTVSTKCPDKRG